MNCAEENIKYGMKLLTRWENNIGKIEIKNSNSEFLSGKAFALIVQGNLLTKQKKHQEAKVSYQGAVKIIEASKIISSSENLFPEFPNLSLSNVQQSRILFFCEYIQGIPTTVVKLEESKRKFISWDSNYFIASGYTPKRRCEIVSNRLNMLIAKEYPTYLTHGQMNHQQVICSANKFERDCQELVFTLKPNEDGGTVLRNFLQLNKTNFSSSPLLE
ncbi:COP23 domain-containing protein [Aulosira sp. FACHB-615]|uniref:COP23 domain-containing protein n=1 Tax=Aulosira sp. FACHB-615 TaxID=2692777 RepID=UPI001688687F|nr:COP23 domain-containing protein [Aulosira sp. FACHB-615]MBD2491723.1 hypothetical protein [Aulosira sp. FACHB-615]